MYLNYLEPKVCLEGWNGKIPVNILNYQINVEEARYVIVAYKEPLTCIWIVYPFSRFWLSQLCLKLLKLKKTRPYFKQSPATMLVGLFVVGLANSNVCMYSFVSRF